MIVPSCIPQTLWASEFSVEEVLNQQQMFLKMVPDMPEAACGDRRSDRDGAEVYCFG